jgi:hypothetical protein
MSMVFRCYVFKFLQTSSNVTLQKQGNSYLGYVSILDSEPIENNTWS